MTGPLEAAAAKVAAPAAKESWKLARRLSQKLKADHGPIGQCPNLNRGHSDRVVMRIAVAPSRSSKPVPASKFVRSAQDMAGAIFAEVVATTDHSGKERVRFLVRDSHDPARSDQHLLEIYPSGFLLLQWGLNVTITPDAVGPFPVSEFIKVLRRVHSVVQLPAYHQLHDKRLGETRRRLDWRVGVSYGVSTGTGTLYVSQFDTPRDGEFKRAVRHDLFCDVAGFAPQQLMGLKPAEPFERMLQVIIEDMMANAGITDPQQATEVILTDHRHDWS